MYPVFDVVVGILKNRTFSTDYRPDIGLVGLDPNAGFQSAIIKKS